MSSAQLQQAISLLHAGRQKEARAMLVKFLQQEPDHELAWLYLAGCLETPVQKRFCLERALEVNPQNVLTRRALARLQGSAMLQPASRQSTGPEISAPAGGKVTFSQPLVTGLQPAPAQAFETVDRLSSLLEWAQAAETERRFVDAYAACSQAIEVDPSCAQAWIGKGFAAAMLSTPDEIRVKEAMQCFHTVLDAGRFQSQPSQIAEFQHRIATHNLEIAVFLNRLSNAVDVRPMTASRLARSALYVLSQAYSYLGKGEDGQRLLGLLRQQVHYILEYEQRIWQSRRINLFEHPDLIERITHSIKSLLPADLNNDPSVSIMLEQVSKPPLPVKSQGTLSEASAQPPNSLLRIARYIFLRFVTLLLTLCVGVYIAVIVANLGGYVDSIVRANIDDALNGMGQAGYFKDVPPEDLPGVFEEMRSQMEEAAGLYRPFLIRCAYWTTDALLFRWSNEQLLEALPNTLLLFGIATFLLFFASLWVALALSLRYGSWLDRLMVVLSPLSSAPSWVHGILLIVIFAVWLQILPFGGKYDVEIPDSQIGYAWMIVRHLILPVGAVFLSIFFQLVYTWRTFFLIHSGEDYVEVARAKGLPSRLIEQRYVLRPSIPFIITNYSLMVLGFWQSAIALEMFFDWPGIGRLYMSAVALRTYQQGMVISLLTIFAYLLAASFFLLDVFYALVDPRVKMMPETQTIRVFRRWRLTWNELHRLRQSIHLPRLTFPRLRVELSPGDWAQTLPRLQENLRRGWHELMRYPSALVGLAIIAAMLAVSTVTIVAFPYEQAVVYWNRTQNLDQPRNAMPAWTNLFRRDKLPETIIQDSRDGSAVKHVQDLQNGMKQINLSYIFDYNYDGFPQDLALIIHSSYDEKRPYLTLTWITPTGQERDIGSFSTTSETTYLFSIDKKLQRRLKSDYPQQALFIDPLYATDRARRGSYELRVSALVFEKDADLDCKLVIYGQLFGLAGTDHLRRNLTLGLLWGALAGLGVGFLGALITSLASMFLAALGVWFGGVVDSIVQRLSEINLTLPMLPIGIMVYYLYTKNIWVILMVIVVFTVFGSPIKNYRAAFLQFKNASYIEAAQAYGASNWRIIRKYLIPRILPVQVPQLVAIIPGFIFLEATLAMLGVYDLVLPTWGKIIYDALTKGALKGYYYWILEPLSLLFLTGMAFAMVGFALDRIFNPRLRTL